MFLKIPASLAAITLLSSFLHADPSVVVTFSSIHDRVRNQNPDLAAARLRIAEALGRAKQSGRLENPNLETSFEHNSRFREGRAEIGISQKFPVTNRLSLEKNLSLTELQAAEAEVREVERQLVSQARHALIDVLALRQRRELLNEQSTLTTQLAESITQAAEKGEGSLLDAGQARVEAIRATTEVRQLNAREALAVGTLKPLLGMRADEGLVVSGSLPNAEIPVQTGFKNRPDYEIAKLESAAAAQQVTLEQAARYQDPEAGIFAAAERSEDAPEGYDNEAIIGLRFSIPLPLWNRNEGAIEEAQAREKRKRLETRALGRAIENEAEAARNEMAEWQKLTAEISTTLLPLAAQQAEQTEAAWHNGQADFQTVLRAREQRLQLAITRLDALRDFHHARVRYQSSLGN
jgi:outer membrane protein, heavy metal efflux system